MNQYERGRERAKTMPATSDKLKRCPFCGGEPSLLTGYISQRKPRKIFDVWFVNCKACGITGANYITNNQAIVAWNTRTQEVTTDEH